MFGSVNMTLIISNEEINNIMKIAKLLEKSGLWIKGITETIKNEAEEQTWGFIAMLLSTLVASLLGNLLAGKGIIRASGCIIRAGHDF